MTQKYLTAIGLLFILAQFALAGPKDHFSVTTGIVLPAGSFDQSVAVNAAWYISPLKSDIDGRAYVGWWSADRNSGRETVSLTNYSFGFDLIKKKLAGFRNLYAGAGVSYHIQLLSNSLEYKPDRNETKIGVSPFIGVFLPVKFARLYAESRYTIIGGDRNFLQLSAGVALSF